MTDGFDRLGANGLKVGVSNELRKLFDMTRDPAFVKQHNDRLRRKWDTTGPDHVQAVYALFDIIVDQPAEAGMPILGAFKQFDALPEVMHHQFYFQAEKEMEYWALKYLGFRVSASFYVRSYATGEWHYIERKSFSLS